MLTSFALYRHLPASEKLRIARAILAIRLSKPEPRRSPRITSRERGHSARAASRDVLPDSRIASPRDETAGSFGAWLRARGQSERGIRDFWDLIVVPSLNCRCDDVSAAQALFVFREGFLKSSTSAAVGVPAVGLSQLHVDPAVRYIEARDGRVRTGETATALELSDATSGDRAVAAVVLASGERVACDAVIAALPPHQLFALIDERTRTLPPFDALPSIRTSPIVNLHLWFDGSVAPFEFAAFTGCDLQWVFNRTRIAGEATQHFEHLVVSLSAAERFMPLDKQALLDLLVPQLRRALPAAASRTLLRAAVIKEPHATFVPAPGLRRPGACTPIANLFLAGAYTDTGWPATMESAVRSGQDAAAHASRLVPAVAEASREPSRQSMPAGIA
jgi:squalene-associated FAD-dependent desaturase